MRNVDRARIVLDYLSPHPSWKVGRKDFANPYMPWVNVPLIVAVFIQSSLFSCTNQNEPGAKIVSHDIGEQEGGNIRTSEIESEISNPKHNDVCTPECGLIKSAICMNFTSRLFCDDYNENSCLVWGNIAPCPPGLTCIDGDCVCVPECDDKECGVDGCGGQCGVCESDILCSGSGKCECNCSNTKCGSPSLGCPSCGECQLPLICANDINDCVPCSGTCELNSRGDLKECGDNGCGHSCGECPPGYVCDQDPNDGDNTLFECEPCVHDCVGKNCGPNGCGGSCGVCAAGGLCVLETGKCDEPCLNPCGTRECGIGICPEDNAAHPVAWCDDDNQCQIGGCDIATGYCLFGPDCGQCPEETFCNQEYKCESTLDFCSAVECGPGPRGPCGSCPLPEVCNGNGKCVSQEECLTECIGKACNKTSCGQSCGDCPEGSFCDSYGYCRDCKWGCWDRECGPDHCENYCGGCEPGEKCIDGNCVEALIP